MVFLPLKLTVLVNDFQSSLERHSFLSFLVEPRGGILLKHNTMLSVIH